MFDELLKALKAQLGMGAKNGKGHYSVTGIFLQSAPLLMALVVIEIGAGQFLEMHKGLAFFPMVISLIPLVNGVSGNIGSILGARLSSALHIGTLRPHLRQKELYRNIATSMFLASVVFIGMSIVLIARGLLTSDDIYQMALLAPLIAILAGLSLSAILVVLTVGVAFVSFKKGFDPDNVVVPVVTTLGDVMGIVIVLLYARLLL